MNNTILNDFLAFKARKKDLISTYGDDLHNVEVSPIIVKASDVVLAIDKYTANEIDMPMLLDWVNTIWFTDLYEYMDNETDSISSVLDVLETLDEDGVALTKDDFADMKNSLLNNQEYIMTAK